MPDPMSSYIKEIVASQHYHPIWYPTKSVAIGDYGTFNGDGDWQRYGRVKDKGFAVKPLPNAGSITIDYVSAGDVSFTLSGTGTTPVAPGQPVVSGTATISFKRGGALVVETAAAPIQQVDNFDELNGWVKNLVQTNDPRWEEEYWVVHEVVKPKAITILISGNRGATVDLAAKGQMLGLADLGRVGIRAKVGAQKSMSQIIVGRGRLTPFFRCLRWRRGAFGRLHNYKTGTRGGGGWMGGIMGSHVGAIGHGLDVQSKHDRAVFIGGSSRAFDAHGRDQWDYNCFTDDGVVGEEYPASPYAPHMFD
jgi:hypothetical protein